MKNYHWKSIFFCHLIGQPREMDNTQENIIEEYEEGGAEGK